MNNILVYENTYYSLFLYMLYDKDWLKRDYLIFGNRISTEFISRLKETVHCIDENTAYNGQNKPISRSPIYNPLDFYKKKIEQKNLFNQYNKVIGNIESIDNSLVKSYQIQIEDGVGTRQHLINGPKKRNFISALQKRLYLREATHFKSINQFIIAEPIKVLDKLKNKVIHIDIKESWKVKTDDEKNIILKLFDVDSNELNIPDNSFDLLLTQPLNEDNNCTEQDKILGYSKLMKEYNLNEKEIIIKPHPKEKTDYKKHFPNAIVINKDFPVELVALFGIKFNHVITLFSTAASIFSKNANHIIYAKAPKYFNFKDRYQNTINRLHL
ncbi:glycosyltransferase family 52 [uncultured Shewanella sp.]|uniref:glycosyltransferase family 52 n=1 Tax=uncultured Shewanella sp. TaxID=173975 RepID=UPI002638626E|nr:glycosyltransferase family 52 [uncultured Shewanella sp.]